MTAVFVRGFDRGTDEAAMKKHFSDCGKIKELYFQSKGSAVVTFENADDAAKAVKELDGSTIEGQKRYVAVKLDEHDREDSGKAKGERKGKGKGAGRSASDSGSGRSIYISGFDSTVTDESTLHSHFGKIGKIEHLHFQSKGSAVIVYVDASSVDRAVSELHESYMEGQSRYVAVRVDNRAGSNEGSRKGSGKSSGSSVFASGFAYETDDAAVRKHFGEVGEVTDLYFQSKGACVITYKTAAAANRAVDELHESYLKGQDRYVAVKLDDRGGAKGKSSGKGKSKGRKGRDD